VIPLQMLFTAVLARLDREQREVIAVLREEHRVLKAHPGRRRLRLNDDQRRRLAMLGQRHLRRALGEFVAHYHGERNHQGLGNELIHWWACQRRRVLWRPATTG